MIDFSSANVDFAKASLLSCVNFQFQRIDNHRLIACHFVIDLAFFLP
jgi:hypothetical protein